MVEPHYSLGIAPRDLVRGDVELASPPEIYARVTELIDDPRGNVAKIAAVVEKDPGLTARLLKIVNSAFFGFPSEIATVGRAITIVGLRELQELILATCVLEMFDGLPNDLVDMRSFWHKSLRCAVLSKAVARQHDTSEVPDFIFVAGLLHEIGHLILYRKLPELSREAVLRQHHGGLEIHTAERQVFGFDYAQVGGELMRAWKLPPVLSEVVAYHVSPASADRFRVHTCIVHLAARVAPQGFDSANIMAAVPAGEGAWKAAGISPERLEHMLGDVEEQYEAALALIR